VTVLLQDHTGTAKIMPCLQRDVSIPGLMRSWLAGTNLVLASLPGAVPSARLHTRLVLAEWGLSSLAEDMELIVSELVTNAIQHAGGDYFRIMLRSDGRKVCVFVWDQSFVQPMPAEPDVDAPDGRGLVIVEALSERWGFYRPQGDPGKIIWAVL
jgi:anti-sigma regulatory factor (Ser/Thr protein kinase)